MNALCRATLAIVVMLGAGAAVAAPPEPSAMTPALVDAAVKEGKVVFYTSIDLPLAEKVAKAFEAAYPAIKVQVERSGAERNFQRLAQEYGAGVHAADVIESSDESHFLIWKEQGWLASYLPEEVAKKWPADRRDPDGCFATDRFTLAVIGYNTKQVKAEEAPKSYADLLDKKWVGRLVKAHPSYSGTTMTTTFQIARDVGWDFLEKLSKQRVMQVQSATDPSRKIQLGERSVMADGGEYNLIQLKEAGVPVEIVYPTEGAPMIPGSAGIAKDAPHPQAARLFVSFLLSRETQQMMSDVGGTRSVHPDVVVKAGRKPLAEIKVLRPDAAEQLRESDAIKTRYAKYFGV